MPAPFGHAFGFDLAHFQGQTPPFGAMIDAGASFFYVKATHGLSNQADSAFLPDWRALAMCRGQAVKRGPYMWLTPGPSPESQVDRMFAIVDSAGYDDDDLPPAIDFEDEGFQAPTSVAWLERAIAQVRARFHRTPLVYTGLWFWREHCGYIDSPLAAECPLWFAQYPRVWKGQPTDYVEAIRALGPHTTLPKPWASRNIDCSLWQFDGDGGLRMPNGVDVDTDVLREDVTLDALISGSRTSTIPAPPPIDWHPAEAVDVLPTIFAAADSSEPTQPGTPTSKSSQSMKAVKG